MVMNEVNAALLKMFASNAIDNTEARAGEDGTTGAGIVTPGSPQALGAVDEEIESGSEVRLTEQPSSKHSSEAACCKLGV